MFRSDEKRLSFIESENQRSYYQIDTYMAEAYRLLQIPRDYDTKELGQITDFLERIHTEIGTLLRELDVAGVRNVD